MATFEDNAVVTAEDLNNIAVDLGDTTFSAFSEEKFGVDKLNEITADLVSKGILTAGDRCEPIISDGKVYIKSGVIVFGSGAKIKITEPVEVGAAAGDYIYAYNDVLTGKASIIASAEMPDAKDDKVVMLARLSNGGTIESLRQMSVANITLSADVTNRVVSQSVDFSLNSKNTPLEIVVEPALPSCTLFVLTSKFSSHDDYPLGVVLSETEQNVHFSYGVHTPSVTVRKSGGLLYFKFNGSFDSYEKTMTFLLA